jgi:processive 1,2-diacylglycerol beta-glucosyltransferase
MSLKRIILMYISEISGHHSATLAIEKAIKMLSPEAKILNINAFNYTNPISEKIVNSLYMSIIKRTPRIWDYLYDNPEVARKVEKIKETIHKFNSPKLKNLFDRFNPDVIACAQAFPCGMVADFKKSYNSSIPLVAVLTDYIPHSYWIYDTIDYYVAPSDEVSERLIKKKVSPQKIKTLGIPFDPEFNVPVIKDEIMRKLNLDKDKPVILIMGGGHGLGPIKTIVKYLEKTKEEFQEIIVSGVNKKLYSFLKRRFKKFKKRIVLFGYVDNIHELMSVADLIITKPGGVTVAEALAKNLPMIIVRPIPGQEVNNTNYLVQKQAAIKIDTASEINSVIEDLLRKPDKLKGLSQAASRISKPNASLDIAKLLLNSA